MGDVNETQADYLNSVGVPLPSDINVADNVVDGVGTEYQVPMSTTSNSIGRKTAQGDVHDSPKASWFEPIGVRVRFPPPFLDRIVCGDPVR